MNKNDLWDKVFKTNPKNTKEVSFGRRFTSICAYSQIEKATELWGSFGNLWGVENEKFEAVHHNDDRTPCYHYCFYSATLFYPDGKFDIHSDIEIFHTSGKRAGQYNEDWPKKVATDALTKGLSKLGFNADIFQGKFEDKYYIQDMNIEFGNIPENKKPQTISPDMITELTDMVNERPAITIEKMLEGTNSKFGTKYKQLCEIYTAHYDWIKNALGKYKTKD